MKRSREHFVLNCSNFAFATIVFIYSILIGKSWNYKIKFACFIIKYDGNVKSSWLKVEIMYIISLRKPSIK